MRTWRLSRQFCANGSLWAALQRAHGQPWTLATEMRIAHGIAAGVAHLHAQKIVHRDLAARNVLLDKHFVPKVADFGLSRFDQSEEGTTASYQFVGPVKWMVSFFSLSLSLWKNLTY